jgi:tight adherence protein B
MVRSGPLSKKQKRLSTLVDPIDKKDVQDTQKRISSVELERDIGKLRESINDSLSRLSSDKLQLKLSSVYWAITDTEFILIRIIGTTLAFLLGWIIPGNILGGIFLSVVVYLVPPFLLDRAISGRQKKFQDQLLDVLILIKGSVQSGYGLMQALDLAVREIPNPASEEFGRVINEINLGLSLEDALFNLVERMENDDLQIVATAIIINSQVGGNLSTVLEASISTIRDRLHLMGEIRSLTAYSRYVGYFLTALPFLTGGAIFVISPDYFDTVKTSLITQIIFAGAFIGVIFGNIWISKIVKIKV